MSRSPLPPGVYTALVTPYDSAGKPEPLGVARLLAHAEASGCQGVVLAGTNGEGPSLSPVEKRDLLSHACRAKGSLKLILGLATSSLDEAIWLGKQASKLGADALLVMPPYYFRNVTEGGIEAWLTAVCDAVVLPVLIYNHPAMSGFPLSVGLVERMMRHERCVGLKDSSGEAANLLAYRRLVPEGKSLFVGDERLLPDALRAEWSGSISGAANVIPEWLVQICRAHFDADEALSCARFEIALPVLQALRAAPQPATNKAVLHALGLLDRPQVRPPLEPPTDEQIATVLKSLQEQIGIRPRRCPTGAGNDDAESMHCKP